jgi:type 2 lantibiotic biosynthesis protein LanM
MDPFYDHLIIRAATIDEVLSDEFEALPGQKMDTGAAAQRLAAWCRSCASGDWRLFSRRLERDNLTIEYVLSKFATIRRRASVPAPSWVDDAIWIEIALRKADRSDTVTTPPLETNQRPFDDLMLPVVERAYTHLLASVNVSLDYFSVSAWACLQLFLLDKLCALCAPAIYDRFAMERQREKLIPVGREQTDIRSHYNAFVIAMQAGGFHELFENKPVLLRLISSTTRQWIDASSEFIQRLDADIAVICRDILHASANVPIAAIHGNLSDPHNNGRSVLIVEFENGQRVIYKPKDLNVDTIWHSRTEWLNRAGAPVQLRAAEVIARDGYGWSEYVEHTECVDKKGCKRFFERAGAWLALFHCFSSTDIHQENLIASGEHPVPIDLETILQTTTVEQNMPRTAFEVAKAAIENSVLAVGLLPAYGRSSDDTIFEVGGVASGSPGTRLVWKNLNSDKMRPTVVVDTSTLTPNLPHIGGAYAKLGDYLDDFIVGFESYAKFLISQNRCLNDGMLFESLENLPVRKVIRPTQFYYMLLQRLMNHRTMNDGILWSAQADFLARLSDWDDSPDTLWPLQRAERLALLKLNVPHFISPSDGNIIGDAEGFSVRTGNTSGLERARTRLRKLDTQSVAWEVDVIRQNTASVSISDEANGSVSNGVWYSDNVVGPKQAYFADEADVIADEIAKRAIRYGPDAEWICLGLLADSEISQLTVMGPDLYNGTCGIAVFLAAHAMVTKRESSGDLALAAVSRLRRDLKSRNAPRVARSLGIGGAIGLGSVVYALTVMSKFLGDDALLRDALQAAALFGSDLIAADKRLDVLGGSSGAILGLLRLHRETNSSEALNLALKCGEHLLAQPRVGDEGSRSWKVPGPHARALNGMSHGAAGFACSLNALAIAARRPEFRNAAWECIAFENSTYDLRQVNWPDFRDSKPHWRPQWCHGATGIGLARAGMVKQNGSHSSDLLIRDVSNALAGTLSNWPGHVDTLCCGTLGSIEFFREAGDVLGRKDISDLASQKLATVLENSVSRGDYRWNSGSRRFNLGLFRGLSGIGYTCLRQIDPSLPNILIWE